MTNNFKTGTWYPIDTAPKDGTNVLVYGDCKRKWEEDAIAVAYYSNRSLCTYKETWISSYCIDGYVHFKPSHWMPLPKAPDNSDFINLLVIEELLKIFDKEKVIVAYETTYGEYEGVNIPTITCSGFNLRSTELHYKYDSVEECIDNYKDRIMEYIKYWNGSNSSDKKLVMRKWPEIRYNQEINKYVCYSRMLLI